MMITSFGEWKDHLITYTYRTLKYQYIVTFYNLTLIVTQNEKPQTIELTKGWRLRAVRAANLKC